MLEALIARLTWLGAKDPLSLMVAAVAFLVSLLSFLVSLSTLYFNVVRASRLRILVGGTLGLMYEAEHVEGKSTHARASVFIQVVVINDGARHGALTELTGNISRKATTDSRPSAAHTSVNFEWVSFVEAKNIAKPDEPFRPRREFAGWAAPIDVPGHESVSKEIRFLMEPITFTEGSYTLELVARAFPRRRWLLRRGALRRTGTFEIGPTNLARMAKPYDISPVKFESDR